MQPDAWWNVARCSHLFHLARKNGLRKVLGGDSDCTAKASSFPALFVISYSAYYIHGNLLGHFKANLKLRDNNLLWKKWLNKHCAHSCLEFWAITWWRFQAPKEEVSSTEGAVARQDLMSKNIRRLRVFVQWSWGKTEYTAQYTAQSKTMKLHSRLKISY